MAARKRKKERQTKSDEEGKVWGERKGVEVGEGKKGNERKERTLILIYAKSIDTLEKAWMNDE